MTTRLGDIDLHLVGEGRHEQVYEKLGAHVSDEGVAFAVWAPNATKVSVVGEWNDWDGRVSPLEQQGSSGIWETVDPSLLPAGEAAFARLLTVFELEKAVYELRYELNNRPEWIHIPVAGILRMLEETAKA